MISITQTRPSSCSPARALVVHSLAAVRCVFRLCCPSRATIAVGNRQPLKKEEEGRLLARDTFWCRAIHSEESSFTFADLAVFECASAEFV